MHHRRGPAFPHGFTLLEILVVVAILGMTTLLFARVFQNLSEIDHASRRRFEEQTRLAQALRLFTDDVRQAKAVLGISPERITLWRDDSDHDDFPGASELLEYLWTDREDAPSPWVRASFDGQTEVVTLMELHVGGDSQPPGTRHLVIHAATGPLGAPIRLGSSVSLRRE